MPKCKTKQITQVKSPGQAGLVICIPLYKKWLIKTTLHIIKQHEECGIMVN